MANKNKLKSLQDKMSNRFKKWFDQPKFFIALDTITLILILAWCVFSFIKFKFSTGLLSSIFGVAFFIAWNTVIKRVKFSEPNGMIVEEEPEAYVNPKKVIKKDVYIPANLTLDEDTIATATAQKETMADRAAKLGSAVVDTKNAVKSVFIKGRVTLDEFSKAVISKGTSVASLVGEPIFSQAELNTTCPLNVKVDNGIYSGAFELVEVQKVPYYGYSSVLLKVLPGDMFNYFDTSVKWEGIPFNTNFITFVDKKSNALTTLEEKYARMSIWVKCSKDVYLLQLGFISTNVSNKNSFNEIKKFLLTTLLATVGQNAEDTYIECGLCPLQQEILVNANSAKDSMDKSVIQGKCDFKIPGVLLGIQGTTKTVMDTPANMDYLMTEVNGVDLKRCANSSTMVYTLFTYALDSMRAKKFFTTSETLVTLNTTVFKPALVKDMMKWILEQYSMVPDCIAIDISTGVGSDTIHVLSSVNGITLDTFNSLDEEYLSAIFRMNSVSAYSGSAKPTDIRIAIHSSGRTVDGAIEESEVLGIE